MLIMYVVYCVALAFNSSLERWAKSYNIPFLPKDDEGYAEQSALVTYKNLPDEKGNYNAAAATDLSEQVAQSNGQQSQQGKLKIYWFFCS